MNHKGKERRVISPERQAPSLEVMGKAEMLLSALQ